MPIPPLPLRRLLLPVFVAVILALAGVLAVAAIVGVISAVVDRRRRLLRTAAFGLDYCGVELAALAASFLVWLSRPIRPSGRKDPAARTAWLAANRTVLTVALGHVLSTATLCFGFHVVEDGTPVPAELLTDSPVLVVARHGGPGDSFALAHLLLDRYGRNPRIVAKAILQLDPALDVLLNRLGCLFLGRHGDRDQQVGRLAERLGDHDALLLFPEGGNYTPGRRARVIRHLQDEHPEAAAEARMLRHVLPPRPGGILACLTARPGLDVVVATHAGLDNLMTIGQAWNAIPVERPMTVHMWRVSDIPLEEGARKDWLLAEWAAVDDWIDAYHARHDPPGSETIRPS